MSGKWLWILLLGAVLLTGGTIYKWVDEKGVTHYSEAPPPQQKSKPIEIPAAPAASSGNTTTPAGKTWQQEELEFQQRQREREAAASGAEAKRRAATAAESMIRSRCVEAKARLEYLQSQRRGPAATRNEKGEFEWWNFEQRGTEINELGRFIDQNCAPN